MFSNKWRLEADDNETKGWREHPATNPHPIYSPQSPRFISVSSPRCVPKNKHRYRTYESLHISCSRRTSRSRWVEIIYNSVLGQLLPLYECSVAERSKAASVPEVRDTGTWVDVRIRHRRDTCSLVLFPTERQRSSQIAGPVADWRYYLSNSRIVNKHNI
jgi:hypothetical protein